MLRRIQEFAEKITAINGKRAKLITEKQRPQAERDNVASRLAERDKVPKSIRRSNQKNAGTK
jgi:hypothetical protein